MRRSQVSRERGRPTEAACVRAVWEKLLPGLLEHFDAQHSLSCIAPRPLLIANNAADPRCPRAGVEEAVAAARPAWAAHGSRLELLMDESVAAVPLPPDEWKQGTRTALRSCTPDCCRSNARALSAGHVITPDMWNKIDAFIESNLRCSPTD